MNKDLQELKAEVKEIKRLLLDLIDSLENIKYSGDMEFGEPNHISNYHSKYLVLNLKKNKKSKVTGD